MSTGRWVRRGTTARTSGKRTNLGGGPGGLEQPHRHASLDRPGDESSLPGWTSLQQASPSLARLLSAVRKEPSEPARLLGRRRGRPPRAYDVHRTLGKTTEQGLGRVLPDRFQSRSSSRHPAKGSTSKSRSAGPDSRSRSRPDAATPRWKATCCPGDACDDSRPPFPEPRTANVRRGGATKASESTGGSLEEIALTRSFDLVTMTS